MKNSVLYSYTCVGATLKSIWYSKNIERNFPVFNKIALNLWLFLSYEVSCTFSTFFAEHAFPFRRTGVEHKMQDQARTLLR